MQKLADIEQIACDPGQKMPHLLIIIERERQLLVMPEDIPAHIRFHLRPHDMPEICDIKIAENLQQHKRNHQAAKHQDRLPRLRRRKIYNLVGDVPDHQRYDKRHYGSKNRKEHIAVKQSFIWPVVGK